MQRNFPANKDQSILIKETDKYFWHVEQSRIDVNPNNPRDIRKTTWVKVYRTKDYKRIFEPKAKDQKLKAACLIAESRLVHDGPLQKLMDIEAAALASAGKAQKEREEKARKDAEDRERLKAEIKAEINDDLGQGDGNSPGNGDDIGTAKRTRKRT